MAFYGSAILWSKKQWLRSSSGGLRTKFSPREGATAGKSQGSERPHGEGLEQGFLILPSQNSAILSVVFLAIMASTSIRFVSLIYDCNLQKHEPGSQTKVLYQVCVASTHTRQAGLSDALQCGCLLTSPAGLAEARQCKHPRASPEGALKQVIYSRGSGDSKTDSWRGGRKNRKQT